MKKHPILHPFVPAQEAVTDIIEELYDLINVKVERVKYDELPDFYKEAWKVLCWSGVKDPISKFSLTYGDQQIVCYMDAWDYYEDAFEYPEDAFSIFMQIHVNYGINLKNTSNFNGQQAIYMEQSIQSLREFLGEEIWNRLLESETFI